MDEFEKWLESDEAGLVKFAIDHTEGAPLRDAVEMAWKAGREQGMREAASACLIGGSPWHTETAKRCRERILAAMKAQG